jgi:hypothetical protein
MNQKNLLIINFSEFIGLELTYSLARKKSNLLLNGDYDINKRSELVKSIVNLGVKCFHHGADISDSKELDILLTDTQKHLDTVDIVLILISLKNYKFLFPVFDKSLEMLNERNHGKLINLFFFDSLEIKEEIDQYCNEKIKKFINLEYSSKNCELSVDIDQLVSYTLYNELQK